MRHCRPPVLRHGHQTPLPLVSEQPTAAQPAVQRHPCPRRRPQAPARLAGPIQLTGLPILLRLHRCAAVQPSVRQQRSAGLPGTAQPRRALAAQPQGPAAQTTAGLPARRQAPAPLHRPRPAGGARQAHLPLAVLCQALAAAHHPAWPRALGCPCARHRARCAAAASPRRLGLVLGLGLPPALSRPTPWTPRRRTPSCPPARAATEQRRSVGPRRRAGRAAPRRRAPCAPPPPASTPAPRPPSARARSTHPGPAQPGAACAARALFW